jgi:ankyrin repeat protein
MGTPASEKPEENYAWAVKTGDLDGVKRFVEHDKLSVNFSDSNQRSPMHWAADFNQVAVMQYLVSKGANVNAKDKYGITPLLAATYEGHADAVKFLLQHKADTSVKGPDGMTAKDAAEKPAVKALFA